MKLIQIFVCVVLFAPVCHATSLPRTIIALYSGSDSFYSLVHMLAEMPLNQLGLKVVYYNIDDELPDIKDRVDVRGVITWFTPGTTMDNPLGYLEWAKDVVDSGKKFVLMGDVAFLKDSNGNKTPNTAVNHFLKRLGLKYEDDWVALTYDSEFITKNPEIIEFERKLAGFKPQYERVTTVNDSVEEHLVARQGNLDSVLVATFPNGGYVAAGYAFFHKEDEEADTEVRRWYINPFLFFRKAFTTDDLPKPDVSTIAGRRIYYSHIDGDGWNNVTRIEGYKNTLSSEVVMEKVIIPYSDFPVTVTAIAADIDPDWAGHENSREIARKLFALSNVEIGSHTYSHPFEWEFFADENPEKERKYLSRYSNGSWEEKSIMDTIFSFGKKKSLKNKLHNDYTTPRAFANKPFDINLEISGSIKEIETLAPPDKHVKIIMWSGNTLPFEKAVYLSRKAGVKNINGGDSRFDREYPSYCWVAPVGRQVGNERQIYASNSNENTYTDLWTGRYYGFRYLVGTLENTETPVRIKPFNIYYHMYSGERQASLDALIDNLDYARTSNLTPVTASEYAGIADGFYSTKITSIDKNTWEIQNRGKLQTIRFDNATFLAVDFAKSGGVVGQRHFQGSLYVYLDQNNTKPIIALKKHKEYFREPDSEFPYLIDSRWLVWNIKRTENTFSFSTQGFGNGKMIWKVQESGNYTATNLETGKVLETTVANGILKINLEKKTITPWRVTVELLRDK